MVEPQLLAVLHDSPDFGGHELAFLTWLPALLESPRLARLDFWVAQENNAFADALAPFLGDKARLLRHPFTKKTLEPLRAFTRVSYARAVRKLISSQPYNAVLLLQGRIENLATPMTWLPRNTSIVSYVPMAHSAEEMGRGGAAGRLADLSKRRLYARADRWIVPAEAVKAQLRRGGSVAPVYVVENVPPPNSSASPKTIQYKSSDGRRIALFMGRFDAAQKGLDRLVRDLRADVANLVRWRFVFVGAGSYLKTLKDLRAETQLDVEVHGWTQNPGAYLRSADVLMMPSRFEGVPLLLLEALQAGIPVLASDIDVFREYLPPSALHDFGAPAALAPLLERLVQPAALTSFRDHAARVSDRLNIERSQVAFEVALLGTTSGVRDGRSAA